MNLNFLKSRNTALASLIGLSLLSADLFAADKNPDLEGTWMLVRAERSNPMELTPLAEDLKANYDFAKDDPALQCIPASWARVYSNPNTPIEITQNENSVQIRYELFDIVRTIPLVDASEVSEDLLVQGAAGYPSLGKNIGWYEDDELVIYSTDYGDEMRVLTTIRQWAGLHQSPLLATEERYKRSSDTVVDVKIIHFDPLMSTEPFTISYPLDLELEWELAEYGCDPHDAAVNTVE